MDDDDAVISAVSLGKKYGSCWGLKNSTFSARKKELAVLLGPNGAGKTTTSKIFATVLKPSKGNASILGLDTVKDHRLVRERISFLPQEHELSKDMTPLESVTWNLMARGSWTLSDARFQAKKWLETLGMWEHRNKLCWRLSGGQKRRVAVAVTLSPESEVVLLDEPTVGLDVEIKHTVWKAVRETVSLGTTILLTTHDMDEAETISDKVIIIDSGETITEQSPRSLVNSLPYRYRIVAGKARDRLGLAIHENVLDLGDRVVYYSRTHVEAMSLVDELSRISTVYSVGEVGLEDAYVHVLKQRKRRDGASTSSNLQEAGRLEEVAEMT